MEKSSRLKHWQGEDGDVLSTEILQKIAKSWNADMWEEFLEETVDSPLREELGTSHSFDDWTSDHSGISDLTETREKPQLTVFVSALIKALSSRERQIIIWSYWHGESQARIGRRLGISKSSVRNYRDRALRKVGLLMLEKVSDNSCFDLAG